MIKKSSKFLVWCSLGVLILSVGCIQHTYAGSPSTALVATEALEVAQLQKENRILSEEIEFLRKERNDQEEKSNKKLEDLEAVTQSQKALIQNLEYEVKSITDRFLTNRTIFENWGGFLLGCVSVLVTVLGVGIALLSCIGYRELIAKGSEKAELIAAEKTQKEFDRFIEDGKLDAVIAEVINKISFRGIANDPALDEEV